jgi:hypothetical protein
MIPMRRLVAALLVATATSLGACGGEEDPPAGENLIDAETADAVEQNTVELGGIRYRVVMFRQINPRLPADTALYEGPLPQEGAGVFAAFLRACNPSDEPRTPTTLIDLEDAFGRDYPRLEEAETAAFAYDPEPLAPDDCIPPDDGAADRAFPGAVILFRVPFENLGRRPFVLELRDPDAQGADALRRIELDL